MRTQKDWQMRAWDVQEKRIQEWKEAFQREQLEHENVLEQVKVRLYYNSIDNNAKLNLISLRFLIR